VKSDDALGKAEKSLGFADTTDNAVAAAIAGVGWALVALIHMDKEDV
jgi:hypothetical protein